MLPPPAPVLQPLPAFAPLPLLSLDLLVHEAVQALETGDQDETFVCIERFGASTGSILAKQCTNSVTSLAAACRVLAKDVWPKIFGHAAEISDRVPLVLEDSDFALLRRHRQASELHSEICVFAVCVAQGVLAGMKFPCSVRFEPQSQILTRLRLVIEEL